MKTLLFGLGMLLMASQAMAAPYDLDQPPENYTWGESQAVVKSMLPEAQIADKHIMYLPPDHSGYALAFIFWQNKLVSISRHSGRIADMATAQAQYQELKTRLSSQWGSPSAPTPCLNDETDCTMVTWQPTPATTLKLALIARETLDGPKIFITHAYSSSQLFPEFARENKELGRLESLEDIMPLLAAGKNPDAFIGRRIRLTLRVEELEPLTLDGNKYSVVCQMQDDKALAGLRERDKVTVSGVIDGVENKTVLLLSQVKLVDRPGLVEQQPARASQGYFQAERLAGILDGAAGQVDRDFSVKNYLSEPYKVSGKVIINYSPPAYPKGLSFSLDNILSDNSSNTLSFNIAMPQGGPQPNGHLVMACMSIVMYASQPGVDMNAHFGEINRAMKDEKPIEINGWTYTGYADKDVFIFSAIAPGK